MPNVYADNFGLWLTVYGISMTNAEKLLEYIKICLFSQTTKILKIQATLRAGNWSQVLIKKCSTSTQIHHWEIYKSLGARFLGAPPL